MDLVRSNDLDRGEYERFLDGFAGNPGTALAYHYPFYLNFLADRAFPGSTVRFIAARDPSGDLAGVLPALHVRTAHLAVSLSLAYFGPNGGALVPDASGCGGALVQRLVEAARDDARDHGCGSMTIYTPWARTYRSMTPDSTVPTSMWRVSPSVCPCRRRPCLHRGRGECGTTCGVRQPGACR